MRSVDELAGRFGRGDLGTYWHQLILGPNGRFHEESYLVCGYGGRMGRDDEGWWTWLDGTLQLAYDGPGGTEESFAVEGCAVCGLELRGEQDTLARNW